MSKRKGNCSAPRPIPASFKRGREVRKLVEQAGITDYEMGLTARGHIALLIRTPDGGTIKYTTAGTPSDARSHMRTASDLRKIVRSMSGMQQ